MFALDGCLYLHKNLLDSTHLLCRVVEYATYEDMKNAVRKLDGADLNGRRLRLTEEYRGSKRKRLVRDWFSW